MAFWVRQKYNLPPTDPRFLLMTQEDIEAEYLAHQAFEKGAMPDVIEDENFTENVDNIEELMLGESPVQSGNVTVSLGDESDEFEDVIDDQRH